MVRLPTLFVTAFALACLIQFSSATQTQEGRIEEPWRPILPKAIYQELANREAAIIRAKLDGPLDDMALGRARLGAVLLGAMTMSLKDNTADLRGTRSTAMLLAETLKDRTKLDAAKVLAVFLPGSMPSIDANMEAVKWTGYLWHPELMDHFRPLAKGGDGLHPDLQSNIPLKGALNSVEDKVRALAMKELTPAGMKTEAK